MKRAALQAGGCGRPDRSPAHRAAGRPHRSAAGRTLRTVPAATLTGLLLAAMLGAVPAAHAQDPQCTRDLPGYVGVSVTAAKLASVGMVMAEHFGARTRDGQSTTVTAADLQQLQRAFHDARFDDCALRRELQALATSPAPTGAGIPNVFPGTIGPNGFAARAVCGGARGTAWGHPSAQQALAAAVDLCVARGGSPACCAAGAFLIR